MKKAYTLTAFIFIFFLTTKAQTQTLVNQIVFDSSLGAPVTEYNFNKGIPLTNGGFGLIQDSYISGLNENGLEVSGYTSGGSLVNQTSYNFLNGQALATNLYCKGNYLYVIAASLGTSGNDSSFCNILKININTWDTAWSFSHSISGTNISQIPSAILVDDTGNIFIAASVQASANSAIYVAKLDSNANMLWATNFDSTAYYSIGVGLSFSNSTLNVTGFMFNNLGMSDYISYGVNRNTGVQGSPKFTVNGVGTNSNLVGGMTDLSYNNYIVGTSATGVGGGSVILAEGFDSSYNLLWSSSWGDSSTVNTASAVVQNVPGLGAIIVVGSTVASSGVSSLVVVIFNFDGTIAGTLTLPSPYPGQSAGGTAITQDNSSNIYVTGWTYTGSDTAVLTAAYSLTTGALLWEKVYQRIPGISNDLPYSIIYSGGSDILVSTRSTGGGSLLYQALEYEQYTLPNSTATDPYDSSKYINGEIMVRFNPTILNSNFINNKDMAYTTIDSLMADSIITKLSDKCGVDLHGAVLSKIITNMSQSDSISISRGGDTVPIPKFWSSLLLTNISLGDITLASVKDSLDKATPYVFYTDFNHLGIFDCDATGTNPDPLFSSMTAMSDALHDDDIDWCPAFTGGAVGSSGIKIGIYDSGINSDHEDLQYGGATKIAGGKDYTVSTPVPILNTPHSDYYGHGTAMAGIIGAQTQNGKGVAGVAGGNSSSPGCALYCDKIGIIGGPSISTATLYNALINDASSTGLGLNVINHSYHFATGDNFMHDAFRFAARNGVVNPCSSGDDGGPYNYYPSCFNNLAFTMRIGANDSTGDWASSFTVGGGSNYDYGIDIIAPGMNYQYKILSYTSNSGYTDTISSGIIADGTSFSTAFVSGAAGLMLSAAKAISPTGINVNFAPEDVREILDIKANTSGINSSYIYSGSGRLDVANALSAVNYPKYKIRHFLVHDSTDILPVVTDSQLVNLTWSYELDPYSSTPIVQYGTYTADIYQVSLTAPYTLPAHETVAGIWPLPNESDFWGPKHVSLLTTYDLDPDPLPQITNTTSGTVTMTGYVYHIIANSAGTSMDVWVPFNIDSAAGHVMAFSVWTDDTTLTSVENVNANKFSAVIYPNPASDHLNVSYYLSNPSDMHIRIFDISGSVIIHDNAKADIGSIKMSLDISALAAGLYFCEISGRDGKYISKFVKE